MITIKETKNTYTVFYGDSGDLVEAIINPEDLEAYFDVNGIEIYDGDGNPLLTSEQLNEIERNITAEATEDYYAELIAPLLADKMITEDEAERIKTELEIFINQRVPNHEHAEGGTEMKKLIISRTAIMLIIFSLTERQFVSTLQKPNALQENGA